MLVDFCLFPATQSRFSCVITESPWLCSFTEAMRASQISRRSSSRAAEVDRRAAFLICPLALCIVAVQAPDIMPRQPVGARAIEVVVTEMMVRHAIPHDVLRGNPDAMPHGQRRLLLIPAA